MTEITDPLARKAYADAIVERAAGQLRELLQAAAAELRPFPPFPGAFFTSAVECEPGAAAAREHGCVVVKEDGELYELKISVSFAGGEFGDPASMRDEEARPLALHPRDYLVYAYNGLAAITELLMEREQQGATGP